MVKFNDRMVTDVVQTFWAAMARGELITGAAAEAGTYRRKARACHATATGVLAPVGTRRGRALSPLAFAAAGALLASTRDDSVVRPLVLAGVALACSTLCWISATDVSTRIAPRRGQSIRPKASRRDELV